MTGAAVLTILWLGAFVFALALMIGTDDDDNTPTGTT